MKPVTLLLVLFFIMNGFVLAEESQNPADLILGMWKAEDNSIYKFPFDSKEVFVNGEKYATYRFDDDGVLYLKYIASRDEFEADVQFDLEQNLMTLTEFKNTPDQKTLILKQVPQ